LSEASKLSDQHGSKISSERVPYEIFHNFLQPLCEELNKSKTAWLLVEPHVSSKAGNIEMKRLLASDTKRAINWLYQLKPKPNFNDLNDIVTAYRAADYLQMPVAARRAFVNYLYDHDYAGRVVDENDLATNESGWLVSSEEAAPVILNVSLSENFYSKRAVFDNNDIRFFDIDFFMQWVGRQRLQVPFYCSFVGNKIRKIDLNKLSVYLNGPLKFSIFDFQRNNLSPDTITYIKEHSEQDYLRLLMTHVRDNLFKMKWFQIGIFLAAAALSGLGFLLFSKTFYSSPLYRGKYFSALYFLGSSGFTFLAYKTFQDIKQTLQKIKEIKTLIAKDEERPAHQRAERDELLLTNKVFYIRYEK
jgi:hypothetical protein